MQEMRIAPLGDDELACFEELMRTPRKLDGEDRVTLTARLFGRVALHYKTMYEKESSHRQEDVRTIHKFAAVCRMCLLFHKGGSWTNEECDQWTSLQLAAGVENPSDEATTKVLCDTIRKALET